MWEELEKEMSEELKSAIRKGFFYMARKAGEERYGDITVTLSMLDGVPHKITTSYSDHFVQRKSERLTVNKESGKGGVPCVRESARTCGTSMRCTAV